MASDAKSSHNQEKGVFVPDEHNVLQKHVYFFDRNKDGIVYPWETFQGFRAIGSGLLLSSVASIFINMGLSRKTRPGKPFSIKFPIEIKNIHRAKHGSDSNTYDSEGRFVPEKFEDIFRKHAKINPHYLTFKELREMLKANREPKDFAGWLGAFTEWIVLYHLGKDKDGLLQKETVRAVYDGTLFDQLEMKTQSAKKNAHV